MYIYYIRALGPKEPGGVEIKPYRFVKERIHAPDIDAKGRKISDPTRHQESGAYMHFIRGVVKKNHAWTGKIIHPFWVYKEVGDEVDEPVSKTITITPQEFAAYDAYMDASMRQREAEWAKRRLASVRMYYVLNGTTRSICGEDPRFGVTIEKFKQIVRSFIPKDATNIEEVDFFTCRKLSDGQPYVNVGVFDSKNSIVLTKDQVHGACSILHMAEQKLKADAASLEAKRKSEQEKEAREDEEIYCWLNCSRGISKIGQDVEFLRQMFTKSGQDITRVMNRLSLFFSRMQSRINNTRVDLKTFNQIIIKSLQLIRDGKNNDQVADFLNAERVFRITDLDISHFIIARGTKSTAEWTRLLMEDNGNDIEAVKKRLYDKYWRVIAQMNNILDPAVARMQAAFPFSEHHRNILCDRLVSNVTEIFSKALEQIKQGQNNNLVEANMRTAFNSMLSTVDILQLAAQAQERTVTQQARMGNGRRLRPRSRY